MPSRVHFPHRRPRMRVRAAVVPILVLVLSAVTAHAQVLATTTPEQVGLASDRLAKLTGTLKADADKGVIPGAVVLVARHGKVALFEAIGVRDPDKKTPMTRDAIFRI